MPSEETNLINDFSVAFKERKRKRCKTRREKKSFKRGTYNYTTDVPLYVKKLQKLHPT